MSSCLHAEASVVDPEHEVRALAITALTHLPLGLIGGRSAHVAVQAKFNGHPSSLLIKVRN
jgi:hypothetical protein